MSFFNKYPYTDFHELNLDWCIKQIKSLIDEIAKLDERTKEVEELYQQMMNIYNELLEMYEKIVAGDIPQPILDTILRWCKENIPKIMAEVMKNVYFGLDDDGHFVAYIPSSWSDIHFTTTGYDTELEIQPEFGHLVLSY